MFPPSDLALVSLSTARLTRLATTDKLPEWVVGHRLREWADQHPTWEDGPTPEGEMPERTDWRYRLVSGLDCPFCVGFWLGAANLGAYRLISKRAPGLLPAWRYVTGALALNYLVGHVSSRIDG